MDFITNSFDVFEQNDQMDVGFHIYGQSGVMPNGVAPWIVMSPAKTDTKIDAID